MTKLEEEIKAAIQRTWDNYDSEKTLDIDIVENLEAKAAAEVAKKWIANAIVNYHERNQEVLQVTGKLSNTELDLNKAFTEQWLKENGVA
jgi:hypothetical protein